MRSKAIQTLALGAAAAFVQGALAGPVTYNAIDLGTLGGSYTNATGISENGSVTGNSRTSSGASRAFVYSNV